MWRKKLSCIALLLLLFFSLGIITESIAMASPIREWNFDEGQGRMTTDSIAQKTGIFKGAIEWVTGVRNKALQFFSSSDYVQTDPVLGSLHKWSFTAYVKPTGTGECRVYSEKDANDHCYFYISVTADNQLKIASWDKGKDNYVTYTTNAGTNKKIKRNEWNHITVTYYGNVPKGDYAYAKVTCYLDRRLMGEGILDVTLSNAYGAFWPGQADTSLVRLGGAKNLTADTDFNNIYPWSEIKPTTQNGQDVVKIPKFYYKRIYDEGSGGHGFWIAQTKIDNTFNLHPAFVRSDGEKPYVLVGAGKFGGGETRAQCRTIAQGYGARWGLIDLPTWSAIQMLWLVEYADTNSEKYNTNWRDLKGLWTDPRQFIDGVNIKDRRVYLSENNVGFEDDVFSGDYKDTGLTLPSSGYITNWHYSEEYGWAFIPKSVSGGSSSTYIPDYIYSDSGNRVLSCGHDTSAGLAGLFCWHAYFSSSCTSSSHAARALYIP